MDGVGWGGGRVFWFTLTTCFNLLFFSPLQQSTCPEHEAGKPACSVAQLCLTLCDPMDLLGSPVHRISRARILEWVTISFCRESSQPRRLNPHFLLGRWILYL